MGLKKGDDPKKKKRKEKRISKGCSPNQKEDRGKGGTARESENRSPNPTPNKGQIPRKSIREKKLDWKGIWGKERLERGKKGKVGMIKRKNLRRSPKVSAL